MYKRQIKSGSFSTNTADTSTVIVTVIVIYNTTN